MFYGAEGVGVGVGVDVGVILIVGVGVGLIYVEKVWHPLASTIFTKIFVVPIKLYGNGILTGNVGLLSVCINSHW